MADFGNSFVHDGETKRSTTLTLGTLRYEPPEANIEQGQALEGATDERRQRVGRRGDVFSMGAVFFEMLGSIARPFIPEFPYVEGDSRYALRLKDEEYRRQLRGLREHRRRLRRLEEQYRLEGLFERWLALVLEYMLNPSPTKRLEASQLQTAFSCAEQEVLGKPCVSQCSECKGQLSGEDGEDGG